MAVPFGCSKGPDAKIENSVSSDPAENERIDTDQSENNFLVDIGVATLHVPNDWRWVKSSKEEHGGILLPEGTQTPELAERLIQVHVGSKQLSLNESANELAKQFDGTVMELPFTLDGERALRISFAPRDGELLPAEGVGVVRDSINILFLAASRNDDARTWPSLHQIATTLKWRE